MKIIEAQSARIGRRGDISMVVPVPKEQPPIPAGELVAVDLLGHVSVMMVIDTTQANILLR